MSLELVVNGTPYTRFISATVTQALRTLANDFSFTASAADAYPAIKKGDAVQVLVDGELKLTGHIGRVQGKLQEGAHSVVYTGRDLTGDLINSQIDVLPDIRASKSLTLKSIIEIVLEHLGLSLSVDDQLNPDPFNEAEDILTPQVGQSAFDFIMGYARKRQALLSSNGRGQIVITQAQAVDSGAVVQHVLNSGSNNIIAQDWDLNDDVRFSRYVRRGQLDPRALNAAAAYTSETVENQSGVSTDSDVREGRQQVVVESESYSSEQLKERAEWANQMAKAQATAFRCTVKGHRNSNGEVWSPNTLAQVNSQAADISRKMLLDAVTFSEVKDAPTTSSLQFIEQNVLTLDAKKLAQRAAGRMGNAFKSLG